ncbi:MAG: hypothetical protein IJJ50_03295 [Lachnospiraceae bacterium]|nr:hypothetical protein [Lachnospiraceae bacterium]
MVQSIGVIRQIQGFIADDLILFRIDACFAEILPVESRPEIFSDRNVNKPCVQQGLFFVSCRCTKEKSAMTARITAMIGIL